MLRTITLFLLVICIALYFYADKQQEVYNTQARPVAEQLLFEISNWQQDRLLQHLSPQAKETLTEEQLDKLLAHYRQFGALKSIDELEFSKLASVFSLFGDTRINYRSDASFSEGRAHINLTLVPAGDSYKIYNFSIHRLE